MLVSLLGFAVNIEGQREGSQTLIIPAKKKLFQTCFKTHINVRVCPIKVNRARLFAANLFIFAANLFLFWSVSTMRTMRSMEIAGNLRR